VTDRFHLKRTIDAELQNGIAADSHRAAANLVAGTCLLKTFDIHFPLGRSCGAVVRHGWVAFVGLAVITKSGVYTPQ